MREHLIVPSIGSRDVAWAEWPFIRRFEHFLKLLDVIDDAFNVHASQSSSTEVQWVKRRWERRRSESPSDCASKGEKGRPYLGRREISDLLGV